MTEPGKHCLACGRGTDKTPLVAWEYMDAGFWICPQHLPVLIHDPSQLIGRLPGAEHFKPAEHED